MPLDPMIARGVQPVDVTNAMYQGANLQMQQQRANAFDQRNAMLDQRWQQENAQEQQRYAQEQDQQGRAKEAAYKYELISKGDMGALQEAVAGIAQHQPGFAELFQRDPDQARAAILGGMQREFGFQPEQVKPPPTRTRLAGSSEVQEEFDPSTGQWREIGRGGRWAPQQAPQASADERDRAWYLNASEDQRKLYDRMKGRTGEGQANDGMNDRQRSGVNMQREAALNYAANVTKLGRDEINRIYQEGGPDAVAKIVNEKGKRPLQGWKARAAESLPGGKMVVEAMNADLIGPRKAGGAGLAMMQNPTGPITTPDFQAGEAQFPGAVYPLNVQAEMLRQMLQGGEGQTAAPTSGGREVDFNQLPPGR